MTFDKKRHFEIWNSARRRAAAMADKNSVFLVVLLSSFSPL
jgi:hypothetical protein